MTRPRSTSKATRRQFLKRSGSLVAATALVDGLARRAHAGEDHTIRLASSGAVGEAAAQSVMHFPFLTGGRSSCTRWPISRNKKSPNRTRL